ncbi:ATP-binding cassette domain-containing protein [Ruminococcus sp. 5_1_39BFAA]|uniref:ATP-binding cassette domain-containing protein n=1 Tax=Ruminococcus sp. 5_1_39BFAA TaxID=457412 RepID=UPI00356B2337
MELIDYSLKVGNKTLFENVHVEFEKKVISHVLGCNGAGKSSFAKTCVGMQKFEGQIKGNNSAILIGSASNVPLEFTIKDVVYLLKRKYAPRKVDGLCELLKLEKIPGNLQIKKMSDGQKQKIKLLAFLSAEPKVIILDEFTNALDKNSALDLYHFFDAYNKISDVVIINITHNLSDLEYMAGRYYYINNRNIREIESKEQIVELYMRGE